MEDVDEEIVGAENEVEEADGVDFDFALEDFDGIMFNMEDFEDDF